MTTVEEVLVHFGVKGMKWGTRQTKPPAKSSGDWKSFKRVTDKAKSGGGTKALSNKEMQAFIHRANLEAQFKRLNPSKKEKALQFVADTLLGVGKQQAARVANDVASKQIAKLLKGD